MNNVTYKKVIISEEIVVRDYLQDFLSQKINYTMPRNAAVLSRGVIKTSVPPLVKRFLMQQSNQIITDLAGRGVEIYRIV